MQPDKRKYAALLARKSPPSPLARDCLLAFVFGGAICTVGEGVRQLWLSRGLDTEDTAAATAITMVFLGALLTCLHLYEKLAKYAGAGTIVPITGFANAIVSPAMEFKSEGLILGLGAKLFVIAGPVLVYGHQRNLAECLDGDHGSAPHGECLADSASGSGGSEGENQLCGTGDLRGGPMEAEI